MQVKEEPKVDEVVDDIAEKVDEKVDEQPDIYHDFGADALNIMDDDKMVWFSDDAPYGNVNRLVIEPSDNSYIVTFQKGNYLDGRNNRSFKVKINNFLSRYQPFNGFFIEFYNDLLALNDVEKNDQRAYNLSKVVNQ